MPILETEIEDFEDYKSNAPDNSKGSSLKKKLQTKWQFYAALQDATKKIKKATEEEVKNIIFVKTLPKGNI